MSADRTVELGPLWDCVWARRRRIGALVAAATLVTALVALLLPPWYRAQATLLPPSEEESGLGLANLLRGIGVAGVKVPTQTSPVDVFVSILGSRSLNEAVVNRFDLKSRYHTRLMTDALNELRAHARFKTTDAGTIEIYVEDRDPKRAAAMAAAYVELLDRFNRQVRSTKGRRMREFVERRLVESKTELAAAEQRLTDYQSRHRTVVLSRETSSAMESAARLYAERTALQVRLGVVRSYTRGQSAEAQQIGEQIAELGRQLQALPATGLELARLYRDARTLEQVFMLLTGQYEEARIDEARDTPTLEVLDPPVPPERKSRPHRGTMIVGAFLLSLGVGVAYALVEGRRAAVSAPPAPSQA